MLENPLEKELRSYGIVSERAEIAPGRWHPVKRMTCADCGATGDQRHAANAPPQQVRQKFEQAGWTTGRAPICPACREKVKAMNKSAPKAAEPAAVSPSFAIVRQVMAALEDTFNAEAGRYSEGKSDEIIAKELGVAVGVVIRIREEAFGKLKVPAEIERMLLHLNTLTKDRDDIQALLADLNARIQDATKQVEQLRVRFR